MSMRRSHLFITLLLAFVGCQDVTSPRVAAPPTALVPRFTQGVGGIWTVNVMDDNDFSPEPVCDDVRCTLRSAIFAAASGDRIVFDSSFNGEIDLVGARPLQISRSLTIDGGGRISIDAQEASGVIEVASLSSSPIVTLAGLTIRRGHAAPDDGGSGIHVENANLTLDSVTVTENESNPSLLQLGGPGGGILARSSALTIRNSTISNNVARTGAGIYNDGGSLTLLNTTLSRNDARGGNTNDQSEYRGGAIYNSGTLTVTASTLVNNQALDGGGIFNDASGNATIVRSTIGGNGGGNVGDVVNLEGAGGIANQGTLELRSTTMTRNYGSFGGLKTISGTTIVANSIIAGNIDGATNGPEDCLGDVVSVGHNLSAIGGGCSFSAAGEVYIALSQVFVQLLDGSGDTSGPTATYALIPRGPAVDAGYCPGETVDQRGLPRPINDPIMPNSVDGCDIGSYELQGSAAAIADLMVSQGVDKTSVKQGDLLTYFVRVQNLGPMTAPNVVLNDVLSSGTTFYSAHSNKGTFTAPPKGETGTVTWSLGDMLNQANEVAEIAVTVLVKGTTTITNTATATGNVTDPNQSNNSAAITVSVVLGGGKTGGGGKGGGGNPNK